MTDLNELRSTVFETANRINTPGRSTRWRVVTTDTEADTGVTLVCDDPDHGCFEQGAALAGAASSLYGCCPTWPLIETFSEEIAAYLVALLNADTERAQTAGTPPAANNRAEVLAEAKLETVAWLVKKAAEQPTWDAAVLASKVDRGAVRAFLSTGHYRDAMDEHRAEVRREVLEEITDRLAHRATLYGDSNTVNEVMRDLTRLAAAPVPTPGQDETSTAAPVAALPPGLVRQIRATASNEDLDFYNHPALAVRDFARDLEKWIPENAKPERGE